jgi:valyl-tRNA synthetase
LPIDRIVAKPDKTTQLVPIGLSGYLAIYDEEMQAYRHRLTSDLHEKQAYLRSLEAKLANPKYTKSAPAKVVEETRIRYAEANDLIAKLAEQLADLN